MINLAIIGTGARAVAYVEPHLFRMRPETRITALCNRNVEKMERFRDKWFGDADEKPKLYTDYMDVLRDPTIDGVIICTHDTTHKQIVLDAFEHGKHIILEKPVATTVEDAIAVYKARMEHPELVFRVAFVLRYSPLYSQIKKLLEKKEIGDIVTIDAREQLDRMHAASFLRRWHRFRDSNGGFMNAKCSHDLDLLTWLVDADPLYMSAFGSRSFFTTDPDAAMHCRDCAKAYECKYAKLEKPDVWPDPELWDACPYNIEGDIVDHEVMAIEYSNGAAATFTVTMFSAEPESNRSICIHGTEGSITADLAAGKIILRKTYPAITETIDVHVVNNPHGGGDAIMFCSFVDAILTGKNNDVGDAHCGMLASVLAVGSIDAMEQHRVIDVQNLIESQLRG